MGEEPSRAWLPPSQGFDGKRRRREPGPGLRLSGRMGLVAPGKTGATGPVQREVQGSEASQAALDQEEAKTARHPEPHRVHVEAQGRASSR